MIDFVAIIRYEIHELAFGDMCTLSFPYLLQQLCNESSIPKIQCVDLNVEMIGEAQTSLIKDLTNSIFSQRSCRAPTVILAHSEGPSIPEKPSDIQDGDMDTTMDFEIGEQREAPKMRTQGDGTLTTFTLALTSTSTTVGVSSRLLCSTSPSKDLGFIWTTTQLTKLEFEIATINEQIWPQVQTTLECSETQFLATMRGEILEFSLVLNIYIDNFERKVHTWFSDIKLPDLTRIRKQVAILSIEVRTLIESNIPAISPEILIFAQIIPPY